MEEHAFPLPKEYTFLLLVEHALLQELKASDLLKYEEENLDDGFLPELFHERWGFRFGQRPPNQVVVASVEAFP